MTADYKKAEEQCLPLRVWLGSYTKKLPQAWDWDETPGKGLLHADSLGLYGIDVNKPNALDCITAD